MKITKYSNASFYTKWLIAICLLLFISKIYAQPCRLTVNKHLFQFCESDTVEDIMFYVENGYVNDDANYEWGIYINGDFTQSKTKDSIYTISGITEPGTIVISISLFKGDECINTPDTIFIEQYPPPTATFSGGGIACNSADLQQPSVTFEGDQPFTLYFTSENTPDSIKSTTNSLSLSTNRNYPLYFNSLADKNCKTDFEDTLYYSYVDVPDPEIYGDEYVCLNDSGIYSADASNFGVEWQLITAGDYMERNINNSSSIQVSWANAGKNSLRARLVDSQSGCTSDWTEGDFNVVLPPQVDKFIDTVICFEQHGFLETNFSLKEGENIFWPDLVEFGAQVTFSNPGSYVFIYTNTYDCQMIGDFVIIDNCISNIHVPEAFTPGNNDNINDELPVFGLYSNLVFKVYSASGILLYEGSGGEVSWDGTYDGELQPAGTYYWVAEFTDKLGTEMKKQGMVRLIRLYERK